MSVKVLAQIVFNVTRHPDQDAALQKQKSAAHHTRTQDLQRGGKQFRPRNPIPILINGVADDERNPKVEKNSGENAKDAGYQRYFVRPKVFGEFS